MTKKSSKKANSQRRRERALLKKAPPQRRRNRCGADTYRVAVPEDRDESGKFQHPGQTAEFMGHENPDTLYRH
jgi:hypothetical protein